MSASLILVHLLSHAPIEHQISLRVIPSNVPAKFSHLHPHLTYSNPVTVTTTKKKSNWMVAVMKLGLMLTPGLQNEVQNCFGMHLRTNLGGRRGSEVVSSTC
jgi:hypothetical protein